jgi:hypothetical protein
VSRIRQLVLLEPVAVQNNGQHRVVTFASHPVIARYFICVCFETAVLRIQLAKVPVLSQRFS